MSRSHGQHHQMNRDGKKRDFAKPSWMGRKHKPYGFKRSGMWGGEHYFSGQCGRYGRKELRGEEIYDMVNKKRERRIAKEEIKKEILEND